MNKKIFFGLRILIAIILIQTLRFKFTAHPDSVYIFSEVGLEPYGRIAIGILELVAAVLILIPRSIWLGSLLTIGLMFGAVFMHLTILGIEINNDNGLLFYMASTVLILAAISFYKCRKTTPFIGKKL